MKVYLDTCILVSLFAGDSFSLRAETFTSQTSLKFLVSDFACAEFASVISRAVRTRELTKAEAKAIFPRFDSWKHSRAEPVETETADVAAAEALATFDTKMAASAKNLGLDLAGA